MKKFLICILSLILFISSVSTAFAGRTENRKLGKLSEEIIESIPENPLKAEQELKKYDIPEAKVYLAYLYMTDKVSKTNKQKEK